MIKIVINGQSISGEYTKTASDSIDYLQVYFTFSKDWESVVKTAQFTQNEKTYNVLVENGVCTVPAEIVSGKLEISVFGQSADGALRITTLPFEINVLKSGFVSDGETPIPPTPDLYSQFVSKVEKAVENIPKNLSSFENDRGFITSSDVPKKISELENDRGFITSSDVPKNISAFENDKGFITNSDVPTNLSSFENDRGFITSADVPKKISDLENDKGFIMESDVPKNLSDFENDKGFITESDIPKKLSGFENDRGFITSADVPKKISDLENDKGFITESDVPKNLSDFENDTGFVTKSELFYDTIIHSQEEWKEMTATEDWNGARNILLMTAVESTPHSPSGGNIPSNVLSIDGCGNRYLIARNGLGVQEGSKTILKNIKFETEGANITNINGIYNCELATTNGNFPVEIRNCKNIIGCSFFAESTATKLTLKNCDTIIFDKDSKELFNDTSKYELVDCTNVIFDGAYVTPSDLEIAIGDINAVLDELHGYAQALIAGGVSE